MAIVAQQPEATPNILALSPHTAPPDGPNKRGQRGIQYATTPRLLQLKERYDRLAADPASDIGLQRYSRELMAEIDDELRERSHLVRGVS